MGYLEQMRQILSKIKQIADGSLITDELVEANKGNVAFQLQANQAKSLEKEIDFMAEQASSILDWGEKSYAALKYSIVEQKSVDSIIQQTNDKIQEIEQSDGSEFRKSVQDQINSYVKFVEKKKLDPHFTGCKFYNESLEIDESRRVDVITVNCPPFPTRSVGFSFTDTPENWESTVDRCENVLIHKHVHDDGKITKTYAAWGSAGSNSIAF